MRVTQLCGPIKRWTWHHADSVLRNYCTRKPIHHEGTYRGVFNHNRECYRKVVLLQARVVFTFAVLAVVANGQKSQSNQTEGLRNSPIIYYPTYYPVNRKYLVAFYTEGYNHSFTEVFIPQQQQPQPIPPQNRKYHFGKTRH